jgi:lipopolysaccharide/colanic/teichoic acid biosynthesis glycosyltransferase
VKQLTVQRWILAADSVWIVISMLLAYVLRYGVTWHGPSGGSALTFLPLLLAAAGLWAVIFSRMRLDGFRRGWQLSATLSQLFVAVCFLILVLLAIGYLSRFFVSRLTFIYFGCLLYVGFVSIRYAVNAILVSRYFVRATRRVLIVGDGPVARELAVKLERHPEMLCQVVGFLCSTDASLDSLLPGITGEATTLQTLGVIDLLHKQRVDEVILAVPGPSGPEIMNLAAQCRHEGVGVSVIPRPYELYLSRHQLLDIGGLPVLQLRSAKANLPDVVLKRVFDIVLGFILLVGTAPITALGMLVLLHKRGGLFRPELRCGQFGKPFRMWRLNSERTSTTLRRYEFVLQQLSITELPQLWNVLRGDMSLVGPRPESPERVKHYSEWQRQRLNAKPGVTGLAQVQGLREQHSSDDKTRFDLQYMLESSLFLDFALLLQTFLTLAARLLHLSKRGPPVQGSEAETSTRLTKRTLTNAYSAQPRSD